MLNRLSRFAVSTPLATPLSRLSRLPQQALSPHVSSSLSVPLRLTSNCLFKGLQVKPESHLSTGLSAVIKPLASSSTRLFSSALSNPRDLQLIVTDVKTRMEQFRFCDKPTIDQSSCLKDGRQVQVRRLNAMDADLICDFYANAGPWSMFDSLASPKNKVSNICDIILNAANIGNDALVAIVGGKIVGVSEYEDRVGDMEVAINSDMLYDSGLDANEVCVAKTMVVQSLRDFGVGTALKREQMLSARNAGYEAIVSLSRNPAMLHIVTKMGGFTSQYDLGSVWSLIDLRASKAPVALPALAILSRPNVRLIAVPRTEKSDQDALLSKVKNE